MKLLHVFVLAALLALPLIGCGDDGPGEPGVGDVANGETVYDKRCAQCHGAEDDGDDNAQGDAKGPGAAFMLPRPRIFADNGSYKFRTTVSGGLPTDWDLYNIISRGLPGTAMPGFEAIPEQERWDLVAYLKSLNEDFVDEDLAEDLIPLDDFDGLTEAPELTEEMAIAGKALYEQNKCWQCHGKNGRGNGESFPDLKDDFPYFDNDGKKIADKTPILPTNLTNPESYRGGATPIDIFRTITTGLNGTPMPAYLDPIPEAEDRWALVAYMVQAFHPPKKETRDEVVRAIKVDAFPEENTDDTWADAPQARFTTLANVIEPPRLFWTSVEFVSVQAMYTDTEVTLRVQWDDRTNSKGANIEHEYEDRDTGIYTKTDHPDQFAVQFAAKNDDPKVRPYFMLGDSKRAANLWWWTAHDDRFVERAGKGYGAITDQPQSSQGLAGNVTWDDGRYTMIVKRTLLTDNPKNDVQFTPGAFLPVAFNVWNGSRGEVGQRRALTTWYWLQLMPQVPERVYYVPPITFAISFFFMLLLARWTRRRREQA